MKEVKKYMNKTLRKIICIAMLIALMTTLTACMTGTYVSESGYYEVKFKAFGKCTWTQGGDSFFTGTYEKEDDGSYSLLIEGSGLYSNTKFTAVEEDNGDLIIEGGNVYGERFIKD